MSVAVATDPTISYNNDDGSNGVINPTPQDSWKWGATSGTTIGSDTGSFFQLQDSSNGAIKNLTLVFDKLTDPTNTPTQAITEATSIKTLTIKGNGQVSGNNAVFTVSNSGSGKGILLGAGSADDTRGTLTFNFLGSDGASKDANWNYTNDTHKRKIILNLTDSTTLATSNQKVSLVGDILIKAGKGIRNANDLTQSRPNHQSVTNTNEFEATFGDDVIGNISIKPSDIKDPDVLNIRGEAPYSTDKQSGYRDIKSTFTFTAGSLNGNILSEAGENTFTFNGSNVKIDGSITANNGYYDTSGTWGAGSENEYVGGVNIINFTHAGTITGDISANVSGQNKITFSGNGTILGKIISGKETSNDIRASSANHNNLIVFNGASATIGASTSTQASIIVNNKDAGQDWSEGRGRYSNNTIVFNSTANNIYLDKLYAIGEVGTYSSPDFERINLNILSFNNDSATNTLQANEIKGSKGSTIIGKNLYSSSSGEYDSTLFEEGKEMYGGTTKYKATGLYLKNDFVANFLTDAHTAKGTYTLGVINGGATYINVENLTINKDSNQNSISSNNGGSHIYATTLEIKGNVSASGGSGNTILVGTSGSILGNISAHDTSNTIKAVSGTLTIGASGARVNLTAKGGGANGINTITANTLNAYFGTISAGASGWMQYANSITANDGTINITSLVTSYYSGGGLPNPVSNSVTLKQGSLTIGSIATSGNYGTDNKNIFTLGESGAATTQVTGTINTSGSGAKTIFNISNASSTLTLGGSITASDLGTTSIDTEGSITFNGAISSTKATNTITAKSGTATIAGISTLTYNGSKIGNTIDLGTGSITINARSGDSDAEINGKAIYAKNENNSNSITANSITVNGDIYANSQASNSLTASSSIAVTGNINGGATNNFTLTADRATLTLNGVDGGTTHTITSLTATTSGTNTLTLDNSASSISTGAMTTTIHSITNGNNLDVVLKGQTGKGATLILDNSTGTALKSVTLGTGATGNALTFNAGANSVTEKINVGSGQDLTLTLAGSTTSLNLAGGLSGGAVINVNSSNATTLSGGMIDGANLTLANATNLTLKNTSAIFTTVDASAGSATLKLDGTLNAVNATIGALNGGNTTSIEFNGKGEGKGATLAIQDSDQGNKSITLKNVSLASGSTNNTLDLSALTSAVITDNISVGQNQALKLKASTLTLANGLSTTQGTSEVELLGNNATLILQANTQISALTAQSSGILEIDSTNAGLDVTVHTFNGSTGVKYKGNHNGDLVINGGTHTLSSVGFDTNGKGALTLNNTFTTIASAVSANGTNTLDLTLTNSNLKLSGASNTISSLTATDGKSVIDLATTAPRGKAGDRKTLTISDYKQGNNAKFIVYADTRSADKVIFSASNGTTAETTASISVIGGTDLFNASYVEGGANNVMIADASAVNGTQQQTDKINIQAQESYIGGVLTVAEIIEGKNGDAGKYYIGKIEDRGLGEPEKEIANTALTVNYDLFLANFNSLNKRMGELRDNPHSQGVWARVFGGAMSNDFGAGSKSEYVTAQAGYDYSLTLGNANNYMGIAIAYGKSWTKSNDVSTGGIANGVGTFSLDEVDSNMVEVGIYNSYVMDSGWYNDTIFKFDYIMSEFSLSNDPTKTSTNNFAMVLSDEFGYRYKFAESEKGNWYIDPQVEVAFGYFNQSDFNRVLFDAKNVGTDVQATQDSILNLRTRAGLSLGKKFNTAKGFASLYVGAFYEYDYIEGGNTTAGRVGGTITQLDKLESNGRAIVNVGSNIELTEGVRMYIDVEKSFGDKQRVDMQFNFGARYSFGEKTPTLSYQEQQKRRVAPLKVEDKQEANTQASSEQEAKN